MKRIEKAQKFLAKERIVPLWIDGDDAQYIVYSSKRTEYLVSCINGIWFCQDTCNDWLHRGKNGKVNGSFCCKHVLGCIGYMMDIRIKGQTIFKETMDGGNDGIN
jgi:hypothetical protein